MASELPRTRVRYLFLVFLTCCACAAQSIAVGAMGGWRLTDDVSAFPPSGPNSLSSEPGFRPEWRFYDVGGMVEIGLTRGLAVEVDALYHRSGFSTWFYHDTFYYTDRERDNSWEFPVLLKYKLRFSSLTPFVEAGIAPRTITGRVIGTVQSDYLTLSPPSSPTVLPAGYSPTVGFVAGGGLQFKLGHLHLEPQVRYTRWTTAPVGGFDESIEGTYSSNQTRSTYW